MGGSFAGAGNYGVMRNALKVCFAAGTPLRTPDGAKPIETVRPGDLVLSRDEGRPDGLVVAKRVEEVYARQGRIWHLHVGGQVIRTTGEHPFFASGRGWTECRELATGDWLLDEDGRWRQVEDLLDTGEVEPVYNVRVADFHTYFVGCIEWGFAVWAHNYDWSDPALAPFRHLRDQMEDPAILNNPAEIQNLVREISIASLQNASIVPRGPFRGRFSWGNSESLLYAGLSKLKSYLDRGKSSYNVEFQAGVELVSGVSGGSPVYRRTAQDFPTMKGNRTLGGTRWLDAAVTEIPAGSTRPTDLQVSSPNPAHRVIYGVDISYRAISPPGTTPTTTSKPIVCDYYGVPFTVAGSPRPVIADIRFYQNAPNARAGVLNIEER
jgi:hypothetical protein